MNTQVIVAVSFILIVCTLNFSVIKWQNRKIKTVYLAFAKKHGLTFTFDSFIFKKRPEISGKFGDYQIRIFNTSAQDIEATKRHYYTVAEIYCPKFDVELHISKENILKSMGTFFGFQDVKIGNETLDNKYNFQTNQPKRLAELMLTINPNLLAKEKFGKNVCFKNGKFVCKMRKIITKQAEMDRLEGMLQFCLELINKQC